MEYHQQEGLWYLEFQKLCLIDFYHYFELGHIMGWSVSPSKFLCWCPNAQYLRMWPFLRIGSSQRQSTYNEVIRMSPNPTLLVTLEEEICIQRGCYVYMKKAVYKPRGDAWSRSCSHSPHKEPAPLTPWCWTSSLQNNRFLLFKPSRLCYFIIAVLGDWYPRDAVWWKMRGEARQTNYSFFHFPKKTKECFFELSERVLMASGTRWSWGHSFDSSCLSFSLHGVDHRACGLKFTLWLSGKVKGDHRNILSLGQEDQTSNVEPY